MIKKFKGVVHYIPTTLINAKLKTGVKTARVGNPIDMLIKKGLMVLKIKPEEEILFRKWVEAFIKRPDYPESDLELELKIKGKDRSLGQNGLYWSLVEVLALEVYMENGWEDVIHEELLKLYAPKVISRMHGTSVPKRSKDMDTEEFTRLIEGAFYEINQQGISMTDPADLDQYWKSYAKIRFSGGKDHGYREGESLNDYRKRVNYCEACRKYLRPGNFGYDGHLAHIISRGTGGEDNTWNILHLCAEHHLYVQHQKGWEYFLEKFPHLKGKFEIAHNRHRFKE